MSYDLTKTEDIIRYIKESEKKTPVTAYINGPIQNQYNTKVFGHNGNYVVVGEWTDISTIIEENGITEYHIENDRRNSAIPLLDLKNIDARIEPGAIIRDGVQIGSKAIIMMGALINIGCKIGENSMIDMGAVLGGRAIVGKNCHIGANAVLAGVIEPASATPVTVEDDVMIGANAVILEGVRIGKSAVVAAGAVVVEDVPANMVVAGTPAKVIKERDEKTNSKTAIVEDLRSL